MPEGSDVIVIKGTVTILSESLYDNAAHAITRTFSSSSSTINLRLVSLSIDPDTKQAKVSTKSELYLGVSNDTYSDIFISFKVDGDFGDPAAILLQSYDSNEFYLKSIKLDMPNDCQIYFPCSTWINHSKLNFGKPRVFFSNKTYLPYETPPSLLKYRQDELLLIQGDGEGERVYGQRVHDYDLYNDISNPDSDENLTRPTLGGSIEYPYPRRCRTGRKKTVKDPSAEQPQTAFDDTYVPRDERFSASKKTEFMATGARSLGHNAIAKLENIIHNDKPFKSLEDINQLYFGDLKQQSFLTKTFNDTPLEFPPPGVIKANIEGWKLDEEFGRQRLAGLNPVVIQRLKVFPPKSKLDQNTYGDPKSSLKCHHIEPLMEGFNVEEAMKQNLLYILDYHDAIMPYINKINETQAKAYASRTILYLNKASMLIPIAIELTLPPQRNGGEAIKRIYTSNKKTCNEWLWLLAKTHVNVIDTGHHQLISHWLQTHASLEPIIIASRRQLSVMHPLHKLLEPHFKDTLHINALARTTLINAGGKIELHYTPGKYCMEISSQIYKSWRFDEQSLPKDLLKRGMAIKDPTSKHGLRLTIEDYPYAIDGLDIWGAIERWVKDYVAIYYLDDEVLEDDDELQRWWKEIMEVGHGDHKGAPWWSPMKTVDNLVEVVSTIIWLASAHHAAVNFGQYAYGGYMPNNPCMAKRFIPQPGTKEYENMIKNPERFFLEMVPTQSSATYAMAILEILSSHMSDEVYLGERSDPLWTSNSEAISALKVFRDNLATIEATIESRNDVLYARPNRLGPVKLPYTLLCPSSSSPGLTFRGVPNSTSI